MYWSRQTSGTTIIALPVPTLSLLKVGVVHSHKVHVRYQTTWRHNPDDIRFSLVLSYLLPCELQFWIKRLHYDYVRFEVFTAVTMKNPVFWDVTPCGSCNIPEEGNLLSHRRENLKPCLLFLCSNSYVSALLFIWCFLFATNVACVYGRRGEDFELPFRENVPRFSYLVIYYNTVLQFKNHIYLMKNGVFWDVTPCGCYKNRPFPRNLALTSSGWRESVN
jgi:hypothetical protein